MGLTVTGETKVYRQDKTSQAGNAYTQYSLGVASKDKDGNWVNGFLECQFKKGVEVANKAKIKINNAFYTVSEYNGKKQYKIFVMDFDVVEVGEGQPPKANSGDFMAVPTDMGDLPF
jgi:hypothetical protein